MPLPVAELFQVFRHVLGEQDVTGIATIHHPLGNINSGAGNVGPTAYIHDAADRGLRSRSRPLRLLTESEYRRDARPFKTLPATPIRSNFDNGCVLLHGIS